MRPFTTRTTRTPRTTRSTALVIVALLSAATLAGCASAPTKSSSSAAKIASTKVAVDRACVTSADNYMYVGSGISGYAIGSVAATLVDVRHATFLAVIDLYHSRVTTTSTPIVVPGPPPSGPITGTYLCTGSLAPVNIVTTGPFAVSYTQQSLKGSLFSEGGGSQGGAKGHTASISLQVNVSSRVSRATATYLGHLVTLITQPIAGSLYLLLSNKDSTDYSTKGLTLTGYSSSGATLGTVHFAH